MPNINEHEELWPWEYAIKEGGIFMFWEGESITRKQLAELLETADSSLTVQLNMRRVHSFIFESPVIGYGNYARWDCLNGWTTTIEEAKKVYPKGKHGQFPQQRRPYKDVYIKTIITVADYLAKYN